MGKALIPACRERFCGSFPTLINGKINRKALPEPEALLYTKETFVAPGNPTEITLCEIWSEVLGLKKVGVDTAVFDPRGGFFLK
ncbi:hypothetical protein P4S72_07805 [Vibrio sp. PP-XX7]